MRNIKSIAAGLVLGFATVAITATTALSAPITLPAGLNPGDQYRLAFVTSATRDALSSDINDYNAFVTAAANSQTALAALGTTWMAIASTSSVDARDNTGTNPSSTGVPIYLLDTASTKIADNNADLWDGNIDAALNVTEDGVSAPPINQAYTGTNTDGTASANPLGEFFVTYGAPAGAVSTWISTALFPAGGGAAYSFYATSAILTVPGATIPEPGTLAILGLGLAGLGFTRRRKAAA